MILVDLMLIMNRKMKMKKIINNMKKLNKHKEINQIMNLFFKNSIFSLKAKADKAKQKKNRVIMLNQRSN